MVLDNPTLHLRVGGAHGTGLRAGDHLQHAARIRSQGATAVPSLRRTGVLVSSARRTAGHQHAGDGLSPRQHQSDRLAASASVSWRTCHHHLGDLASAVLGLELRLTERGLRFHDPRTGDDLRSLTEEKEMRQQAEHARQRAEQAQQRAEQERQEAESRLAQEAEARRQEAAARQAAEVARGGARGPAAPSRRQRLRRRDAEPPLTRRLPSDTSPRRLPSEHPRPSAAQQAAVRGSTAS